MAFFSVCITIVAIFLVLFSAAQIGLSGYVMNYDSKRDYVNYSNPNLSYIIYWLPQVNYTRSYILQLVTGIFGVITGVSIVVFSVLKRPLTFVGTGKRVCLTI